MSLGIDAASITACGGIVTGVICGIVACGIATCAPSSMFGPEPMFDCRPIGAGEIIEGAAGAGIAGLALFSIGASAAGAGSVDSICGMTARCRCRAASSPS